MTRDPDRIDPFLERLGEYWRAHPHLRFGQMVYNLSHYLPQPTDDIYVPKDDAWAEALEAMENR